MFFVFSHPLSSDNKFWRSLAMNRRWMVSRQHYQKAYFTLWRKHSCLIFIYHSLNNLHNFTACNYLVSDFENIANSTTKKMHSEILLMVLLFFLQCRLPVRERLFRKTRNTNIICVEKTKVWFTLVIYLSL